MEINSDIFKNLPTDILYNRIFIFLENYTRIELKCYNPVWFFQSERGSQRWLDLSLELMYLFQRKMRREEFMKRWTTGLIGLFSEGRTHTFRKRVYDDGRIEYQITKKNQILQDVENWAAFALSATGGIPDGFLEDARKMETPSFWAK